MARRRPVGQPRLRHRASARSATSRSPRWPRSGSSPRAPATASAPSCSRGDGTASIIPARSGPRTRCSRCCTGSTRLPRRAGRREQRGHGPTPPRPVAAVAAQARGLVVIVLRLPRDRRAGSGRMRALAARHDVLAVEVIDPRELELPDVGVLDARSTPRPVAGSRCRPRARSCGSATPKPPPSNAPRRRAALRGAGAEHMVLRTDRDWILDIVQYVGNRRRRRAGRAVTP